MTLTPSMIPYLDTKGQGKAHVLQSMLKGESQRVVPLVHERALEGDHGAGHGALPKDLRKGARTIREGEAEKTHFTFAHVPKLESIRFRWVHDETV